MSFFTMCVLAAGIGMALGTLGTGIGQGLAVKSAVEGVSRNPGASGKILTTMMIGLAMIESLAIYALVVCLIILFANHRYCTEAAFNIDLMYIDIAKNEGAKLLCGGEPLKGGAYDKGYFYKPTVFGDVTPSMRIAREEIFGPVLSCIKVKDFDEAVKVLNDTPYGLSSSIYTRNVNLAMKAIETIEAGITYVNAPTIGAECHMPFGVVKDTGNGHREGGWTARQVVHHLADSHVNSYTRFRLALTEPSPRSSTASWRW